MPIYKIKEEKIVTVDSTSFANENIYERNDLQVLIVNSIEAIEEGLLVITNEFSNWVDSRRSIDILCLDKDANLVVIELKRTDDGGHMELQAIRYAAMISTLTYKEVVISHQKYLTKINNSEDANNRILFFLNWEEPLEENFGKDIRIILVSADFSKEITTSVLWLNERDLDIKCIRIKPYKLNNEVLLDIQQVIPLPEVSEYQTRIKEKNSEERISRRQGSYRDFSKYDITIKGNTGKNLGKRNAILFVVKNCIQNGIKPEELELGRKFLTLDGEFRTPSEIENEFRRLERVYDPSRWFSEVFNINNKTFVLSNQWGEDTLEIIDKIKNKFPEIKLEIVGTVVE